MTSKDLAKLIVRRMKALRLTPKSLHARLAGKCSHMTVYNAIRGKVIKTDTMLLIMAELGLEIVVKEDAK